jgi:hypothetical protein
VQVSRGLEIKVRLKIRDKAAYTFSVRPPAKEADDRSTVNDFVICIQDLKIHRHGLKLKIDI